MAEIALQVLDLPADRLRALAERLKEKKRSAGDREIEPVADRRAELPSAEVAALLRAIWERAYGIRFPLQRDTFHYMLRHLEARATIGADPGFGGVES